MLTQDAVDFFQGKSRLANALSITPAAISQWGDRVPKLRQFELQVITAGQLEACSHATKESGFVKKKATRRPPSFPRQHHHNAVRSR